MYFNYMVVQSDNSLYLCINKNKLIISTIGEIKSSKPFYDYESKYILNSNLIIPACINKDIINDINLLNEYLIKEPNLLMFFGADIVNNINLLYAVYNKNIDIYHLNDYALRRSKNIK